MLFNPRQAMKGMDILVQEMRTTGGMEDSPIMDVVVAGARSLSVRGGLVSGD